LLSIFWFLALLLLNKHFFLPLRSMKQKSEISCLLDKTYMSLISVVPTYMLTWEIDPWLTPASPLLSVVCFRPTV